MKAWVKQHLNDGPKSVIITDRRAPKCSICRYQGHSRMHCPVAKALADAGLPPPRKPPASDMQSRRLTPALKAEAHREARVLHEILEAGRQKRA